MRFNQSTGKLDFANVISGKNLKVEQTGTGTTKLGANNTYERGTDIYAGNMEATGDTSFGTGDIEFLGTATITLAKDGGATLANNINIGDGFYATIDSLAYNSYLTGVISGDGTLVKDGSGSLTLAANTYTGGTYMDEGSIILTDNLSLGTGDVNFIGDSALTLGVSGLVIDNNVNIDSGVTSTLDSNGFDGEMAGLFTGGAKLRKTGVGTITLSNTGGHNIGGLSVEAGTLITQHEASLGHTEIKNGAILTVQGPTTMATLDMQGTSYLNVEEDTDLLSDAYTQENAVITISDDKYLNLTGGNLEADVFGAGGTVTNQGTLVAKNFEGSFENQNIATIQNVGKDVLNDGTINLGGEDITWAGTLTNNGLVSFLGNARVRSLAFPGIDGKLTVGEVTGNGNGAFNMEISMLSGETSHMLVKGDSSGRFHLNMTDVSADPNLIDPLKYNPVIVRVEGSSNGEFYGNFDAGLWNYDIISIAGPNGATDWIPKLTNEISSQGNALLNMTGTIAISWFTQLDNLHKRMGELRLSDKPASLQKIKQNTSCNEFWVRGYGQQVNTDLKISGLSKAREYQYGGDIGWDRAFLPNNDNLYYLGAFGGYQHADREFRNGSGSSGDADTYYGGMYGTWFHKEGWYSDLVLKAGRVDQEYKIKNDPNDKGKYDTYTFGTSIEFGRQFAFEDHKFLEPSVQFAYLRVGGNDHTSYNGLRAKYSSANVYQFAATIRGGKTYYTTDNGAWQPYGKLGVVAQSSSGGRVDIADESWRPNTDGVRGIIGTGVMWQISAKDQLHFDYEASFAEKVTIPWSVNLGYRRMF